MLGDVLENLRVEDLRSGVGMPGFGKGLNKDHMILGAAPPTNQQILDATKQFYSKNQVLVDTTANDTHSASKDSAYVKPLNDNNWKSQQLTPAMQNQTSIGIFNATGGGDGTGKDCHGLFGPTLCATNASELFSTVSVGVNAEVIFFVGGMGGLGCSFDIAKREGPKGYGFATAELGLKVAFDVNIQATIFNKLPSKLNNNIFGLSVGAYPGFGGSFYMFFTDINNLTILGYSIGIGIGVGGGAAVFGGHLWNFG